MDRRAHPGPGLRRARSGRPGGRQVQQAGPRPRARSDRAAGSRKGGRRLGSLRRVPRRGRPAGPQGVRLRVRADDCLARVPHERVIRARVPPFVQADGRAGADVHRRVPRCLRGVPRGHPDGPQARHAHGARLRRGPCLPAVRHRLRNGVLPGPRHPTARDPHLCDQDVGDRGRPGEDWGTLEQGKAADLLVVDGDPSSDITILRDKDRIQAIVQDGQFQKDTLRVAAAA